MYITFICRSQSQKAGAKGTVYAQIRDKENGINLLVALPSSCKVTVADWKKAHNNTASKAAVKKYNLSEEGRRISEQTAIAEAQIVTAIADGVKDGKEIAKRIEDALVLDKARKDAAEAARLRTSCFLPYFDKFIERMSKGEVKTSKRKDFDLGTQRYYQNTRRYLGQYLNENADITFNDLDSDISDGFVKWMEDANIMRSTQKNVLACIAAVCRRAWNAGLILPEKVGVMDLWKMPTPKEDEVRAEVALSEEEVNALWDLSNSGKLEGMDALVLDVTLAGIYSMQRFSDYSRFSKDMIREIDGRRFLHFKQDKTENFVDVPLVGRLDAVMARNGYDFTQLDPKSREWVSKVNYQAFGKRLRNILKELSESVPSLREMVVTNLTHNEIEMEANFQQLLTMKEQGKVKTASNEYYVLLRDTKLQIANGCMGTRYLWKRNAKNEVIKPKWSLCNSHVCRRTGITLALDAGILTDDQIRRISGHRTLKSFRKYDKRDVKKVNSNIFDALLRAEEASTKVVAMAM